MKTSELAGPALDWAVAKCEGADNLRENPHRFDKRLIVRMAGRTAFINYLRFSTDWSQGGPIIERESITLRTDACVSGHWAAFIDFGSSNTNVKARQSGATPLIAAMRCYVASKLGDEVEIPEELL